MLKSFSKGKTIRNNLHKNIIYRFRLVDIILEKMSDAPEDPSGTGQGNNAYGNQPGGYNKNTARLTSNDSQARGNQCQC
jgi:hypothetical protein